jgi:hypothetical protein
VHEPSRRATTPALCLLLFAVALFVFGCHGKEGELLRDGAIYVYSGKRLLAGVAPFLSMFDHKGPLDTFLCASGIALAHALGRDELATIRLLCLATAGACVPLLFLLGRALFPRERPGARFTPWFAAALLLGCWGFGLAGLGGPDPKTPVAFFTLLALLLGARRSWFWAACAGSIASLGWQPTGVYAAVVPLVAWFQSAPETRRRAVLASMAGLVAPWVLCGLYFASQSALYEFVDSVVIFNVRFLDSPTGPITNLGFILLAILTGFGSMGFPIALGLATLPALYAWRIAARPAGRGRLGALVADPFAVVLLTFPLPLVWSLLDFQTYPDFFIFLPYAALGFGWLLDRALHGLAEVAGLGQRRRDALAAGLLLVLPLLSAAQFHFKRPRQELQRQRADVLRIEAKYGTEARLVSIGVPEVLVFLERVNTTRYGFIMRGIQRHIAAHTPGGFAGWLAELEAARPEVIVVGHEVASTLSGEVAEEWTRWLGRYDRDPEFSRWQVYVRRSG